MAIAGFALALLALAGCSAEATPEPSSSATKKPAIAATKTPTPAPTAEVKGTPVTMTCDEVLSPDDVYALNPNYAAAPEHKAKSDAVKKAESYDGIACGWSNESSGDVIEVSVTQPNESLRNKLIDAAISDSQPVPTYGAAPEIEGFFNLADGTGEAQVFTGKYWIVASSVDFFEPGDVEPLITAALPHLN